MIVANRTKRQFYRVLVAYWVGRLVERPWDFPMSLPNLVRAHLMWASYLGRE